MPCGVNEERFQPRDQDAARGQLCFSADSFALVHVGSLYDWHGLDLLIEALADLDDTRIGSWELWLIGDGVERDHLQTLSRRLSIESQIRFVGEVPYDQLAR